MEARCLLVRCREALNQGFKIGLLARIHFTERSTWIYVRGMNLCVTTKACRKYLKKLIHTLTMPTSRSRVHMLK